jgi:hypothetical protein
MKADAIGNVTMRGPPIDDAELVRVLPEELAQVLQDTNGFILFAGGLHVRGASLSPPWHSLRYAMQSEDAFSQLYSSVKATDIPFAQDCMGDQFLLRDGRVLMLSAETGEIEERSATLSAFWQAVNANPEEFLNFDPNRKLEPGQLLHAYPPFCTKESANGCSIKPIPALELIRFHADFAKHLSGLSEGTSFEFKVTN